MLVGILKFAATVIVLIYGLICLYLGITRLGGGVAKLNMILIPVIFAVLLKFSDSFHEFYMENWDACMLFVLMIFVGSGLLASIADLELLPGLIDGIGLVTLAIGLSGFFPQETVIMIVEFVGKGCAFIFVPSFIIMVFFHALFR